MIKFLTDGGDFAEIRVDGRDRILDLCSDTHDIETAKEVAFYLAKELDVKIKLGNLKDNLI